MKLSTLLTTITASTFTLTLPTLSTASYPTDGGFNENVLSCKNANYKDCKTISLIHELETCKDIPDPTSFKYGDMHSSFQVNGRMACRLFRTRASAGCKNPSYDPLVQITGKDGQRATNWFAFPGIPDWDRLWKYSSFFCTSLEGKKIGDLPKAVVADCGADDSVAFGCRGLDAVA